MLTKEQIDNASEALRGLFHQLLGTGDTSPYKEIHIQAEQAIDLAAENAQLKAKLDAVKTECNKPMITTSDVFGGGIASGHNILKRNILAIIDKEADT